MKASLKGLVAAGMAATLVGAAAPAASAQDCTTVYVTTITTMPNQLVTVTYTPPATITVDADPLVGVATNVANATVTYVDCVV